MAYGGAVKLLGKAKGALGGVQIASGANLGKLEGHYSSYNRVLVSKY